MGPFNNALERLGIVLPAAPKPVGSYVPFVRTGNLVFVSGQLPWKEGKLTAVGAVPTAVTVEAGKEAAKQAALNALAVVRESCGGDLDQVVRVVKLVAFVQSAAGFEQQPQVANGASDLMAAVFGEAGKHARAAVGANALPLNAAVEIELVVEVKPE